MTVTFPVTARRVSVAVQPVSARLADRVRGMEVIIAAR
jgi:hypothetical protein